MTDSAPARISRADLARLRTHRVLPNLLKMPFLVALMLLLGWDAWAAHSTLLLWLDYIALGYLWMSIVTFTHDAAHNALFESRALNWAVGIVMMIPIFASFIAFKTDHLEHHRYNRSPRDPDAFMMGKRGIADFMLLYAYLAFGGVLSFVHFNFIYPVQCFRRPQWAIQLFETALKAVVYWLVLTYAQRHRVLGKTLGLWLWPIFFLAVQLHALCRRALRHPLECRVHGGNRRRDLQSRACVFSGAISTGTSATTPIQACPGTT